MLVVFVVLTISIIWPSIFWNLDYPAWQLSLQKMGVSLKCACALQLLLWRQACLCSEHAQATMLLLFKWVDQGVVYLFNSIYLFNSPKGHVLFEVLLYQTVPRMPTTEYKHMHSCGYYSCSS